MPVWGLYNVSLPVLNPAEGDRVSHGKQNNSKKSLPMVPADWTQHLSLTWLFSTYVALAPGTASSDFSSPHQGPLQILPAVSPHLPGYIFKGTDHKSY